MQLGVKGFDHLPDLLGLKTPPCEERAEPPLPHRRRQPRKLPRPFLRQRPDGVHRVDPLGSERLTHRAFRNPAIDALRLEIAHQASRSSPTSSFCGGIVERKPRVIQQPRHAQPIESAINGGWRMLFLEQATPQVEARVRATRQRPQRRPVCGFEIRQLLQPLQHQRFDLATDNQVKPDQRFGWERRKTPPIHLDQPIVWPVWIGGESGENHSSLAALSSSATAPPPPHPDPHY